MAAKKKQGQFQTYGTWFKTGLGKNQYTPRFVACLILYEKIVTCFIILDLQYAYVEIITANIILGIYITHNERKV